MFTTICFWKTQFIVLDFYVFMSIYFFNNLIYGIIVIYFSSCLTWFRYTVKWHNTPLTRLVDVLLIENRIIIIIISISPKSENTSIPFTHRFVSFTRWWCAFRTHSIVCNTVAAVRDHKIRRLHTLPASSVCVCARALRTHDDDLSYVWICFTVNFNSPLITRRRTRWLHAGAATAPCVFTGHVCCGLLQYVNVLSCHAITTQPANHVRGLRMLYHRDQHNLTIFFVRTYINTWQFKCALCTQWSIFLLLYSYFRE